MPTGWSSHRSMSLAAVAAVTVLAGCGRALEPRAELVFINGVEPETLDPALITGQPEGRLASALFEGLLRFDYAARPVPGVAERWDVSDDRRRYTFHLREGATWSNGDPVVADDFVRSWRRVLAPQTGSDYATLLYCIEEAEAVHLGQAPPGALAAHAEGDRRLVVDLVAPTPYFLDLCAYVTFLPVHAPTVEAEGGAWIKPGRIVTNGPFELVSWRLNDRIRLARARRYWDPGSVGMATIDVLPVNDPNTALNFFATGAADLIMDKGMIPPGMGDVLREQPWFHTGPFLGTYFMRFNVTSPPFDDPRVRRAFAMAIDKRRVVEKITRLGERQAGSMVPPGCGQGYQPPEGLPYDPGGARSLLAEAGFPGGRGFPLVDFLYPTISMDRNIAVELQNMWRDELGVEVALRKQEWKVYLNSLKSLEYQVGRSSWVSDYNDPSTFIDLFTSGNGNNRTGFASARYDALVREAAREPDPAARNATLQEAERYLLEDEAVVAPVYFYVGVQFYHQDRLLGIESNVLDDHPLREMRWATP